MCICVWCVVTMGIKGGKRVTALSLWDSSHSSQRDLLNHTANWSVQKWSSLLLSSSLLYFFFNHLNFVLSLYWIYCAYECMYMIRVKWTLILPNKNCFLFLRAKERSRISFFDKKNLWLLFSYPTCIFR